jgi:RNA polymerase sigma-70 factor (ECF subfamily)
MASAAYTPSMTGTEEAGLIRKVIGGRRDLFANLIEPHLTPLLRIVQRTMGQHADVDDVVQQAALKALTHLEQFRCEASFRTWLIQIALNEARQWRRHYAPSRFVPLDTALLQHVSIADERQSPFAETQRREAAVRLRAALDRLPEKYRTVIYLRDLECLSLADVAQLLGLTVPGVKTRQMRARKKIAKMLGQPGPQCSRSRSSP